jgi:hypothetical protein
VSDPRIYFAPSYGRAIEPDHVAAVFGLLKHPNIVYRPECNDALIERSRSKAATKFLASDCDVHLSIDSDIAFDALAALEICRQAVEFDVVAGIYITRSRAKGFPTSLLFEGQVMDFGGPSRVEPIRWAATGFLAVHRRVYERIALRDDMPLCHAGTELEMRPFYGTFPYQKPDGTWIFLSEDFAFCERAREEGFSIYANPAVRLIHLGQYPFRLEDLLNPEPPRTAYVQVQRHHDGTYAFAIPDTETPSAHGSAVLSGSPAPSLG